MPTDETCRYCGNSLRPEDRHPGFGSSVSKTPPHKMLSVCKPCGMARADQLSATDAHPKITVAEETD